MPQRHQKWTPLDGAVDHSSFNFIVPSRRKKLIDIKRPESVCLNPRSNSVGSAGGVDISNFPAIHHQIAITNSDSISAGEHEGKSFQKSQTDPENDGVEVFDPKHGLVSQDKVTQPSANNLRDLPFSMTLDELHLQSPPSSHTPIDGSDGPVRRVESTNSPLSPPEPADGLSQRSNLDIYAHKYVPAWQKLVNESPAVPIYSPHLRRIDFDAYKLSFASQVFLPRLPDIELPPTEPCQIYCSHLQPHAFEPFWKERLHNEFAAQRMQNASFDLFDHPIRPHDAKQNLYRIKIPGVREYAPRIDLEDILVIRPLQPVLQGTIAEQARLWSLSDRDGLAPGFTGIEHHAVVWSIMRRDEIVIVKVGAILHGDPREMRCNVIIPLQAHKNAPAWIAIELAAAALNDRSRRRWLHSILFPESTDCIVQDTLSKGTFDLNWYDQTLNFEQKRAVQAITNNDYGILPYLVSGPPGTGKTKTLVEAAMQLICVERRISITPHILLCAPSDAAADTLLVRLSEYLPPTKLFRLNNWTRLLGEVPGEVRSFCYIDESTNLYSIPPFEQMMKYQVVVTSCRDANMLLNAGLSNDSLTSMTLNLLRVINPSSTTRIPPLHWTALLLDEAAQATEPEALIPITVIQPSSMIGTFPIPQVVMAGDEHQLGPRLVSSTILSSTDSISSQPRFPTPSLNISLFQRLFERPLYATHPLSRTHGLRPLTRSMLPMLRPPFANLIRNYRSHPAVLSTSSHLFYADTLIPERPDVDPSILSWPKWPSRHKSTWPVMFIQNTSEDSVESVTEGDGTGAGSLINRGEARIVLELVQDLLAHTEAYSRRYGGNERNDETTRLLQEDIIVLSPFRAQVTHLRNLFRSSTLNSVRIGPLEAFQGLESRIVIICTTRTRLSSRPDQPPGKFVMDDKARGLGVIDEPKRFNVAMTRAREGMVVVGSRECLGVTGDRCWRALLGFVARNGLVAGGSGSSERFAGSIGGRGQVAEMGKLERALRWADGLEREEERNGKTYGDPVDNGGGYRYDNGQHRGEVTENFRFRLMGRMVDLDERMWEMQGGDPEVEDYGDEPEGHGDGPNEIDDMNDAMNDEGTTNTSGTNRRPSDTTVWADKFRFMGVK